MFRRHYNLVLMVMWLAIAAVLIAPDWLFGEKFPRARGFGAGFGMLFGSVVLVFVAYNGVKWWYIQTLYRARAEPRPAPFTVRKIEEEDAKYVPNPELDFFKPEQKKSEPET